MSNFPNQLDTDVELTPVNDNITEIGAQAINDLRDAVFAIENNIGIGANGSTASISQRLGISLNADGSIKSSALTSLGLVTLPITQNQIATNAEIPESKLSLNYPTANLFNYIQNLSADVNNALGWIAVSGIKLEPHLAGVIYRHTLNQVDVSTDLIHFPFLQNKFRQLRNNTQSYFLVSDINSELLAHQWADGSPFGIIQDVITNNGSFYPSNFAHVSSGIYLDSTAFAVIPQTANNVQAFANFIDSASILTLGTRIQNLYNNGISRNSRSSSLLTDGYGAPVVPPTPAVAYLRGTDNLNIPFDDIAMGDDIIQFFPSATAMSNNTFDEQFALVEIGDIVRVNYAADGYGVEIPYVISEKKYIQGGGSKIYIVRIAGKNIAYSPNAIARIDRCLFNNKKFGVLATSGVNSPSGSIPSLIVGSPRGAQCLGVNFNADQFDETHYLLYLALYSDGNPLDGYTILPGVDVTGNSGTTPGSYTLDNIVLSTNEQFRQAGFNYRFIAYSFEGEFGIMLADSYNNASFSVISGVVSPVGSYNQAATQLNFPNNAIDLFPVSGNQAPDPLGFGPFGGGIASPPFLTTYGSASASQIPTIIFPPLRRNNYYVNGNELEKLNTDIGQVEDLYGDGYWVATIDGYTANPGPPGHVTVTYNIPLDLSASNLKAGKTIVVQPYGTNLGLTNYGRFIIQNVSFTCCSPIETEIMVYDAVHAVGGSPAAIAPVGSQVAIYFSSDSVSFNQETATDFAPVSGSFKRYFEVYVNGNSDTFTHERSRFSLSGNVTVNGVTLYNSITSLGFIDLLSVSPKLRGFQFGSVNKITLNLLNYNGTTGIYDGYLCSYDGTTFSQPGPTIYGKIGETTRFYDASNVDYIDINIPVSSVIATFTNQVLDFQLLPTLSLDEEIMLVGSCQINTSTNEVTPLNDLRQFGNTSEQELTTSALDYIAFPEKSLHFNGVIRGFDFINTGAYNNGAVLRLTGGLVLTAGNFNAINDQMLTIPALQEVYSAINYPINYLVCADTDGDLVTIVLTDYDSVLMTPNAPNRIVTVINVVSGTTYQLDGNTFSYILNNRKDLTPLYKVSAIVTGTSTAATTALTVYDIRRFSKDSDSNISAVLTSDNSQGNFETLDAALNWLKLNSSFQNTLQIKGSFALFTDPGLNFPLNIVAAGTPATLTFNSTSTITDVTFSGVTVTFSFSSTITNCTFNNCNIFFQGDSTFIGTTINDSTVTISLNGQIILSGQNTLYNSTFSVLAAQGFILTNSIGSNTVIRGNTFTYTFNPIGNGSYTTANLVNSTSGMIYGNISSSISNIIVEDCIFNNTLSDHYPFINLQLTNTSAIIENFNIYNNQFISLSGSNDLRAVIAFSSTLTSAPGGGVYPKYPKLVDVIIENNFCSHDQIILISTDRLAATPITGSMLNAVNCRISNNTCGTIGFITSGNEVSHVDNSNIANNGQVRNKPGQLIIENNSCKFITNLDSKGQYIGFYVAAFPTPALTTAWVQTGTGTCSILNNSTNWIQVGCAANIHSSGIIISGNRLIPNDPAYLNNYIDTAQSGVTPANVAILLRQEEGAAGQTNSIISENTITQNLLAETNGTSSTFYYASGIVCFNNAQIINNNISGGVLNSSSASMLYLWNTASYYVSDNIFNRDGLTIQSYVTGQSGATNQVSITNNFFDSQWVDAANTIEQAGFNIPQSWAFHNNKNQVFYVEMPLLDYNGAYNAITGVGALTGSVPVTPMTIYFSGDSGNFTISKGLPFVAGGINTSSQYIFFNDTASATDSDIRAFTVDLPIDKCLPPNTRVLKGTIGAFAIGTGSSQLDFTASPPQVYNAISLIMLQYNNILTSNSSNGVLDIANNYVAGVDKSVLASQWNTFYVSSSGQESVLKGSTQYIAVDLSAQTWITGNNYRISAEISAAYKRTSGGVSAGAFQLILSPLVIKALYQ